MAPYLIWVAFFATFYWCHRQVRTRPGGDAPEKRVKRDRSSDAGMALQFAAVLIVLFAPGPVHGYPFAGIALTVACILWVRWSLLELGRQWRVQAVIAEGHELITGGPYGLVRHPVYLGFMGMLVATALMRGDFVTNVVAVALFNVGTEIRVRAEEKLLREAFGQRFRDYLNRTRWAYLPGLR